MQINVDPSSSVPIYAQIIDEMKLLLAAGILSPGDKLPSVRNLAVQLRVNPNTVAKAYNEMERCKVIFTKRGQGTFVCENGDEALESNKLEIIRGKVEDVVITAYKFGITIDRVHKIIDEFNTNTSLKEE